MKYLVENNKISRTACWSSWHIFQKHCSKNIISLSKHFQAKNIWDYVEITGILQGTQSMQSLEYSSGYPDGPEMQWNVCDANFAPAV